MLLFVDESGFDQRDSPYEVLAGVAISEDCLWNFVKSVRAAEREHFGDYLRNLLPDELKGRKLLKRKRFRWADRKLDIPEQELPSLAHSLLLKGKRAREQGLSDSGATRREMVAYSRQVLRFVHEVLNIAARFGIRVIATLVDPTAPRPQAGKLRKDYIFLFERYFYLLETLPPRERGLVVFDELERSRAHGLVQQMAAYFLGTEEGRYRSSRIVPEPFFVHSDLTTGVFLADLTAYVLAWGWRLKKMTRPKREELHEYAKKIHEMQFRGERPTWNSTGSWILYGIKYLESLQ